MKTQVNAISPFIIVEVLSLLSSNGGTVPFEIEITLLLYKVGQTLDTITKVK